MDEVKALLPRVREDVEAAIAVWRDLLRATYGEALVSLYAKGSAVKPWDGPIDYVPTLSDLDLHLETTLAGGLSETPAEALEVAMRLSTEHEARFRAVRPNAFHLPRAQLSFLNDLHAMPDVVILPAGVRTLVGAEPEATPHTPERIRVIDRQQLLALDAVLAGIPRSLMDRSGIDLFTLIRRLTWRVSPTPVRLLSVRGEDPREVWTWNRTRIVAALEHHGLAEVAAPYREWYETGWRLELGGWRDGAAMRACIAHAHAVLGACLDAGRATPAG